MVHTAQVVSASLLGSLAITHDAWDAFWDSVPHDQRLLKEDAKEYVRNLAALIPLTPDLRVLDFGCGWGNVARLLGPRVGELYLWDDSPRMQRLAAEAVAGLKNARLLDLGGSNDPSSLPVFDLIIANSVAQFMTAEELIYWLRRWRHMLAPKGHIVVSDLVPPEYPAAADLITLLRFSASRGFLVRALYDAARVMPRYHRTRQARPLLRTSHDQLTRWGSDAALEVRAFPHNLTCFRKRITAVYCHSRELMSSSTREAGAGTEVHSYRLREVVPSDGEAVAWAARLHGELFRDIGLVARLGDRLLRRFCYTVLIRDQLMKATVFEVDGTPAGLAAYTTDSKAVHAAASQKYFGFLLREAIVSVLLDPRILAGVPGAARLLFERRNERIEGDRPVAEMLALGVLPPYRTPEFIRRTGLRVGDLLLHHALSYFKEAGFREARGVVLADNRAALMFFRMRASRVEPYPNAAKPSYQVWFDVERAPPQPRT